MSCDSVSLDLLGARSLLDIVHELLARCKEIRTQLVFPESVQDVPLVRLGRWRRKGKAGARWKEGFDDLAKVVVFRSLL